MPSTFGIQLCVVTVLIILNVVKWAVFGRLSTLEIRSLHDKIAYTVWEFCFGFLLFYFNTRRQEMVVAAEMLKFSGLFACILLLKCFHYLSADRAQSVLAAHYDKYPHARFALGLALLHLVDGLLVHRFYVEVVNDRGSTNILVSIFGFEILNLLPMILLTALRFGLSYYDLRFSGPAGPSSEWHQRKLRIMSVGEFVANFTRFAMTCVFSVVFLYCYTFPLHILPSSYLSLRLLVFKTRSLINMKKRQLRLLRLVKATRVAANDHCIICLEDFGSVGAHALRNCAHSFHHGCLQMWIDYSSTCPVCRCPI